MLRANGCYHCWRRWCCTACLHHDSGRDATAVCSWRSNASSPASKVHGGIQLPLRGLRSIHATLRCFQLMSSPIHVLFSLNPPCTPLDRCSCSTCWGGCLVLGLEPKWSPNGGVLRCCSVSWSTHPLRWIVGRLIACPLLLHLTLISWGLVLQRLLSSCSSSLLWAQAHPVVMLGRLRPIRFPPKATRRADLHTPLHHLHHYHHPFTLHLYKM